MEGSMDEWKQCMYERNGWKKALVDGRHQSEYNDRQEEQMSRAHSFLWTAKFRAEPWNFGFYHGIELRNFSAQFVFSREIRRFSFAHLFSTENDLKITLLHVHLC